MKSIIYVLFIFYSSCSLNNSTTIKKSSEWKCDSFSISNDIRKIVKSYEPSSLNLFSLKDKDIEIFIQTTDSNCLRKNKDYKFFIIGLLMKLSIYHLKEAHQSFDLNYMDNKYADFIVNDYRRFFFNRKETLEFFSSFTVWDIMKKDTMLRKDPYLMELFMKTQK